MIVDGETAGKAERPLHGMLAEFRTALREEIEAARRDAANNIVPLLNGRRIGQIGTTYQYVFQIETVLMLPGDAPGDLIVPGQPPLQVVIVSIDGLSTTLSVAANLGPFVPEARLQSNLAQLMRKLIERIENLAGAENPVGERIRGARPFSGNAVAINDLRLGQETPNPEQQSAITGVLGRDATFIWGPPGTGKSRTIGMIGAELFRRNRSVLLVSHTNNAVDQAILYMARSVGDRALAGGKAIRVGEPRDPRVSEWQDLLLSTHVDRRSQELTARRKLLQENLYAATQEVQQLNRQIEICQWVKEAPLDLEEMDKSLAKVLQLEGYQRKLQHTQRDLLLHKPYWERARSEGLRARSCLAQATTLQDRVLTTQAQMQQLNLSSPVFFANPYFSRVARQKSSLHRGIFEVRRQL